MKKLSRIHKGYQILNLLQVNINGKEKIIHKIDTGKRFEKNSPTVALNTLYITEKEMCPDYVSKINSNSKN